MGLNIAEARDPDRRETNYDKRPYYAKTQNGRFPYHKRIQNERRILPSISPSKKIQNNRKNPTINSMLNTRTFSTARRFLKQKSAATARSTHESSIPDARRILLNRRAMIAKRIQNDKTVPTPKEIQAISKAQNGKKTQNGVRSYSDNIRHNSKVIQYNRRGPKIKETLKKYGNISPSYRRIPRISRLQHDKDVQTDVQTDKKEEREMMNSANMAIIDMDKRMKINKLLEEDRMQQSILRRKMDSILRSDQPVQNDRLSPSDIYKKRIQEKRRKNAKKIENARRMQNVKKAQNTKRNFEKSYQKIVNARRIRNDRRMWVATSGATVVFRKYMDNSTIPPDPPDFNSSELDHGEEEHPEMDIGDDGGGPGGTGGGSGAFWGKFFKSLTMIFDGLSAIEPAGSNGQKVRACLHIATTYMNAHKDLRRYMGTRYFYENNLQYEVGYMTSEIITKYQRMLEIYHIAQDKWRKHQNREFASSIYMLYLYTNILEMGTVIGHLCAMLAEMELRFRDPSRKKTGFEDYHMPPKKKTQKHGTEAFEASIDDYEKRLLDGQKKRRKQRNKDRKKNLYAGYKPTPANRKPRGSSWALDYGWSIEYNW
ncbi:uncharacterized protein LOC124639514 [Helicoverpa zea]|uniref:uncharacterized protein LOC124639514 n=1 Tax=Helicoverpa zea TaxID=7113 RepID=UPI001F590886|nr:uncharacterized protein LOC124639514 [Helicoverpa zea]